MTELERIEGKIKAAQKEISDARSKESVLQGKREAILEPLKKSLGVQDIEDAQEKLEELQGTLASLEEKTRITLRKAEEIINANR